MPRELHRLVYYSHNRVEGSPEEIGAEIRGILAASRRNNLRAGITGALMFNAGCFAQVLEGARDDLEEAFERIQQDERHGDCAVVAFEAMAERHFGQWSMGFVGTRPGDAAAYADIAAASGFHPSKATGEEIIERLVWLALEEEAIA